MPTGTEVIAIIDELRPNNAYSSTIKLEWLNEVEGQIWNEIYKYKNATNIQRVANQSYYNLPQGVTFGLVTKVYVDGEPIDKIDYDSFETTGYYRDSQGRLNIYPVPTESDSVAKLRVVYKEPFVKKVAGDQLFAESPYDKMYAEYLKAKIDLNNKEYDAYNNNKTVFMDGFSDYKDWWNENNP